MPAADPPWLAADIRVRIVDKALRGGALYLKKVCARLASHCGAFPLTASIADGAKCGLALQTICGWSSSGHALNANAGVQFRKYRRVLCITAARKLHVHERRAWWRMRTNAADCVWLVEQYLDMLERQLSLDLLMHHGRMKVACT